MALLSASLCRISSGTICLMILIGFLLLSGGFVAVSTTAFAGASLMVAMVTNRMRMRTALVHIMRTSASQTKYAMVLTVKQMHDQLYSTWFMAFLTGCALATEIGECCLCCFLIIRLYYKTFLHHITRREYKRTVHLRLTISN